MSSDSELIKIIRAESEEAFTHVRALIREFLKWHRQRHTADIELINAYFDEKAFEDELQNLPGKYEQPEGCLLLALYKGEPAGCVAFRKIDDTSCEMKRMFVYTNFHGKGVGKALSEEIVKQARNAGYQSMLLDTSIRQSEAQSLYEKAGFRKIKSYYQLPEQLENWLVFMEKKL